MVLTKRYTANTRVCSWMWPRVSLHTSVQLSTRGSIIGRQEELTSLTGFSSTRRVQTGKCCKGSTPESHAEVRRGATSRRTPVHTPRTLIRFRPDFQNKTHISSQFLVSDTQVAKLGMIGFYLFFLCFLNFFFYV